jgi:hypothetical protein
MAGKMPAQREAYRRRNTFRADFTASTSVSTSVAVLKKAKLARADEVSFNRSCSGIVQ